MSKTKTLWPAEIHHRGEELRYPQEEQEPIEPQTRLAIYPATNHPPYLYLLHQDLDQKVLLLLETDPGEVTRLPSAPAWIVWPALGYLRLLASDAPLSYEEILELTKGREPDAPKGKGETTITSDTQDQQALQ